MRAIQPKNFLTLGRELFPEFPWRFGKIVAWLWVWMRSLALRQNFGRVNFVAGQKFISPPQLLSASANSNTVPGPLLESQYVFLANFFVQKFLQKREKWPKARVWHCGCFFAHTNSNTHQILCLSHNTFSSRIFLFKNSCKNVKSDQKQGSGTVFAFSCTRTATRTRSLA